MSVLNMVQSTSISSLLPVLLCTTAVFGAQLTDHQRETIYHSLPYPPLYTYYTTFTPTLRSPAGEYLYHFDYRYNGAVLPYLDPRLYRRIEHSRYILHHVTPQDLVTEGTVSVQSIKDARCTPRIELVTPDRHVEIGFVADDTDPDHRNMFLRDGEAQELGTSYVARWSVGYDQLESWSSFIDPADSASTRYEVHLVLPQRPHDEDEFECVSFIESILIKHTRTV